MITFHSNIQTVIGQLRKVPAKVAAGRGAALNPEYWKGRAIDVARTTLEAVALSADHPSIPYFISQISIVPRETGFTLRLAPGIDPETSARGLDVRGIRNLPLFSGAFARNMQEAWDIIRDWVEFAKDIDERDEDVDGAVDYDRVTARIHRILFNPTTEEMLSARDRLLRRGDRGGTRGAYLLDFAAGMHAAGAYSNIGIPTARAWLNAIGNAWSDVISRELPEVMIASISRSLRGET
ncbi:MAG: hypothetical protein IT581_13680 [Verrucomicrobiales bacterium]|nr:hypothetical protein [Verrucomicrobiales bacterium]